MKRWEKVGIAGIAAGAFAVIVLFLGIFVYSGLYNVAADVPHTGAVFWIAQTTRDRSIDHHASGISVPSDLDDAKRISAGAGLYGEMCSGCHLAPGTEKTEISQGLYPRAPELSRGSDLTPAQEFWVIKHGIKMSGMAAWGVTHNDTLIWDMVAFLQKLPSLSPAQYQTLVKSAPESHEEMMKDMPGMQGDGHDDHHN
jgi:mono/diheme cytochrome c family protein